MDEEKRKTNWTFLFIMVLIEFLIILVVFIIERYLKNKKIAENTKTESLVNPPNTLQKSNVINDDENVKIYEN